MVDGLLYRQIHPNFIFENRVTSQAFNPMTDTQLSVCDGNMIGAKQAWERYTKKDHSAGVMAVTDGECESHDLRVISDPTPNEDDHMVIDFDDFSTKIIKKIGSRTSSC